MVLGDSRMSYGTTFLSDEGMLTDDMPVLLYVDNA